MPNFAIVYLIVTLSSLGMPLLNGFIGEFAILQGAFAVDKAWAVWGVLGIVLGAAYLLWLYQNTMFGSVTREVNKTIPDLNLREYAVLLPLVAMAFWIGIYPKPFFDIINSPVDKIVRQVNPTFYQQRARQTPVGSQHRCAPNAQASIPSSRSFTSSTSSTLTSSTLPVPR
jgi:NADH-quinone oxidoreductase subunit M